MSKGHYFIVYLINDIPAVICRIFCPGHQDLLPGYKSVFKPASDPSLYCIKVTVRVIIKSDIILIGYQSFLTGHTLVTAGKNNLLILTGIEIGHLDIPAGIIGYADITESIHNPQFPVCFCRDNMTGYLYQAATGCHFINNQPSCISIILDFY